MQFSVCAAFVLLAVMLLRPVVVTNNTALAVQLCELTAKLKTKVKISISILASANESDQLTLWFDSYFNGSVETELHSVLVYCLAYNSVCQRTV